MVLMYSRIIWRLIQSLSPALWRLRSVCAATACEGDSAIVAYTSTLVSTKTAVALATAVIVQVLSP